MGVLSCKMKIKIVYLITVAILLLAGGGYLGANYFSGDAPGITEEEESEHKHDFTVTIYKSPTCGCCTSYINHLKREGFEVEVVKLPDSELDEKKDELGVPEELRSCHTAVWGEYVVEGHVPLEAVKKMGHEHSEIVGIGMADMPSGSPGMPGTQTEPFEIYSFDSNRETKLFLTL
jgi:hypothetical protein